MNESELVSAQEWRCSVKNFDASKKIPDTTWAALEKCLILSPSSYGLQPWKFVVVTDKEIRKKLTPLSWNQAQVENCSHFVVFAYRNKMTESFVDQYMKSISEIRNVPLDKLAGFKGNIMSDVVNGPRGKIVQEWAGKQVYIALGNFMTSAALLGVDTCPMEGIDPPKYDEILGLTGTDYSTAVACAAGYRHSEDGYSKLKKVRYSAKELVVEI